MRLIVPATQKNIQRILSYLTRNSSQHQVDYHYGVSLLAVLGKKDKISLEHV
jgi:hypothetical protein